MNKGWTPNQARVAWTPGRRPKRVMVAIQDAADRHDVTPGMVLGGSQGREVVAARRDAIHALRSFGMSTPLIGKMLGGLHHSSVLHHLKISPATPRASARAIVPDYSFPVPDYSGEWAI